MKNDQFTPDTRLVALTERLVALTERLVALTEKQLVASLRQHVSWQDINSNNKAAAQAGTNSPSGWLGNSVRPINVKDARESALAVGTARGYEGFQRAFGVSRLTAYKLIHGVCKDAVSKCGNILITDIEEARKLMRQNSSLFANTTITQPIKHLQKCQDPKS